MVGGGRRDKGARHTLTGHTPAGPPPGWSSGGSPTPPGKPQSPAGGLHPPSGAPTVTSGAGGPTASALSPQAGFTPSCVNSESIRNTVKLILFKMIKFVYIIALQPPAS